MSETKSLVLSETGVTWQPDGTAAINVGPIVTALRFLTEGRGDDRGIDERGQPLPDLMSLAFDVVQSVILGGRQAELFRKVKQDLDAQSELPGRSSVTLARRASKVRHSSTPTALEEIADTLKGMLSALQGLSLDDEQISELTQAIDGFRGFGADRWVTATAHLLFALRALGPKPNVRRVSKRRAPRKAPAKKARPGGAAKPRARTTARKTVKSRSKKSKRRA